MNPLGNELVKYENSLNSVPFRKFNRMDFNIFFAIVSRMRNRGDKEAVFSYHYLMKLSHANMSQVARFADELDDTYSKMLRLNIFYKDPDITVAWNLFEGFCNNRKTHRVKISVNPKLVGVLNHFVNWTRFSLSQFVKLRSSYSKTMFRLIKQYRVSGKRYFTMKEFRKLLCVPKSYSSDQITRRVLRPIREELTPLIRGLSIVPKRRGVGGRIVGYWCTFKPERRKADDFSHGLDNDRERELANIEFNGDISESIKKNAKKRVLGKRLSRPSTSKVKPKKFKELINSSTTEDLKALLYLYVNHPQVFPINQKQGRKLRRVLKKRLADERKL